MYKRKGIRGWWVGWYESGKRKAKALPSKALAEHFRQIKYTQLNSDVFTGTVTVDWQQMRNEYEHSKKVGGFKDVSIYETALTLRHFERTCYHPLFCFNQFGDLERALLRNGNVHSADDWQSVLEPIIARYRGRDILRFFCGDAGFANPHVYRCLEAEGHFYAIRLKGNQILYSKIEHLLTRPMGRPPKKPIVVYHSFRYRAASWDIPRRVVAKVEWHSGELFSRVGFIVTNLRRKSSNVVKFYNKRGTAEQWIKEGKYALNWT